MALHGLVGLVHPPPLARAEGVEGVAGQPSVCREGSHVEVDGAVVGDVCAVGGDQALDQFDHLRHEAGGPGHQRGIVEDLLRDSQSQMAGVLEEAARVEVRDRVGVARIDLDALGKGA